jgi:hypothetical protein
MRRLSKVALVGARVLSLLGLVLQGCESLRHSNTERRVPEQRNYFSEQMQGAPMRRVAVLPAYNERYSGDYLRSIDSAFSGELTKRSLFEVVAVGRQELESVMGVRQLASVEVLPSNLLVKLREHLGVDGVLFIDLTQFSPYQPVSMGVRMKLVDVSTGQIRWAYDSLFDAANPAVAMSARDYQLNASESVRPIPGDGGSVLLSPTLFSKYVAAQSFRGLRVR